MRNRLLIFFGIIIILIGSFGLIKEHNEAFKAKEQAGQKVSFDVNLLSNYVKSVQSAFNSDSSALPQVGKDELLKYSAKAETLGLIAGNLQFTGALDGYFSVLSNKLYQLSQIIDDPSKDKEIQEAKQEISVITSTLDQGISVIQKAGENNQKGVNFQTWYKIITYESLPVIQSITNVINQSESKWGFLK